VEFEVLTVGLANPGDGPCFAVVVAQPSRPLMRIELGRDATLGGKRVARVESRRRGIFHFILEDSTEVRTLWRSALLLEGARLPEGERTEPIRRRVMVRIAAAIELGRGSRAVVVRAAPELEGLDFGFEPLLAGRPVKYVSRPADGEWCFLVDRPQEPIFSGDAVEIEADDEASTAAWANENGSVTPTVAWISVDRTDSSELRDEAPGVARRRSH
jgi:hypothetical protein